ncbi:P-loop containing nucleoside triphosphate hydrolase protein [Rickenella mellea]|uniref:P-loop containing nucleoside triphosphate hydrolase protein n=1 Tax=Rickenella mellea TaxID=50990 RepID=A0A4Y7PYG9_9AGAM|nr:P-loop containing nucleoside triphosphate hydrolase protein [Rickenella mellea]
MSTFDQILTQQFSAPIPNEVIGLLRSIKLLHPNQQHVSVQDCCLPLTPWLRHKDISFEYLKDPQHSSHVLLQWDCYDRKLITRVLSGTLQFMYQGIEFLVYTVTWKRGPGYARETLYQFVFDSKDGTDTCARELLIEVHTWFHSLKDEIWVFQQGGWMKDKGLWDAIQSASWDDIVLENKFLEDLRRDTKTFFANKGIYESMGITWKRGLLLLGPPGNGKTESIKLLLKESTQAALYVKSFSTNFGPEAGVRNIFEHARNHAPCILVIEDIDSMVTPAVRSFFLNELDGLGKNEGILTIATTNHPERIDDAILNRPSRFDVKYNFSLPDFALRTQYAQKWVVKTSSLRVNTNWHIKFQKADEELAQDVAKLTDGWSFAFLKELFVSFLLRIAHDGLPLKGDNGDVEFADDILLQQAQRLSSQIVKAKDLEAKEVKPLEEQASISFRPQAFQPTFLREELGATFHSDSFF